MSLKNLFDKKVLKKHKTNKLEISLMLQTVTRDIKDAQEDLSADWKFGIAYNAALKLCTILIYAKGYRVGKGSHHMNTISILPLILGKERLSDKVYLDSCRKKRNFSTYDQIGSISEDEASELISFVKEFDLDVRDWLKKNEPELI